MVKYIVKTHSPILEFEIKDVTTQVKAIPTVPFLVLNTYVFTSENEIVISNSTLLRFVLS